MQDYDIYLFDWDGTLADSTSVWLAAVRRQFDLLDLHPSDADIILNLGDWKNMLTLGVREERLDAFRTAARAEALENLPNAPLFPGAHQLLGTLRKKGKKLAVVTAMHRNIIDAMLKHHGYETFFGAVVSGSDVENLKPHPESLLLALKQLGCKPDERVIMLGDTGRDIAAAHEAEVDSLLYYPPEHQLFHDLDALKQHKPTYIITDWSELR